jgi:hypothetical protein
MKIFEHICLAAVTAGAVFLTIELGLFARDARLDLHATAAKVDRLLTTANETAGQARDASEQAKLAAIEQRAYWNKTSLETYKTMASVRLTIVRADHSLNDILAPQLSATLQSTDRLSSTASDQIAQTLDQMRPVLENLARASAAAADTMADPEIRQAIGHADETSAHAAAAADQTAQIAANLNKASADFAAYVHKITTGPRGVWNILHTLLGLAAQSRQASGF